MIDGRDCGFKVLLESGCWRERARKLELVSGEFAVIGYDKF